MRPAQDPAGGDPVLSPHATQRCDEMNIDEAEVFGTVLAYETSYPSPARYGPGRFVATRGRLAVVYTADLTVVTVLWNGRASRAAA